MIDSIWFVVLFSINNTSLKQLSRSTKTPNKVKDEILGVIIVLVINMYHVTQSVQHVILHQNQQQNHYSNQLSISTFYALYYIIYTNK